MKRPKYILLRLLLVAIPLLMAMAPAVAQTSVYTGQATELSVVAVPGDTYSWELYENVTGVNFATDPGNCPVSDAYFTGGINTGSVVNVTWLKAGTYFYKVTAKRSGCTSNLKVGKIVVIDATPTALLLEPPPVCSGDSAILTVQLTGTAPWGIDISDGTQVYTYTNITTDTFSIPVSPTATTSYTVVKVSDAHGVNLNPSNTVTLVVKPRPVTSPIIQYGP